MSEHPFTHVELSTSDSGGSKAFYGGAFGWSFQDDEEMNYTMWSSGEGQLSGGFNPVSDQNPAGTVTVYIQTNDLAATKAKIKAAGGTITLEHMEVPGFGDLAFFQDPTGNNLALWQPA
jgi:hypothetical protein